MTKTSYYGIFRLTRVAQSASLTSRCTMQIESLVGKTAVILAALCTLFSILRVSRVLWQEAQANRAYRRRETARNVQIAKLGRNAVLAVELAEWRADRDKRGLDSI